MSWAEDVNIPISYENGRYNVKAQPYRHTNIHKRDEWVNIMLEYLSTHPGTTQTLMCRKLGVRWSMAHSILDELTDNGYVRKEYSASKQKGEGSKYYLIDHI